MELNQSTGRTLRYGITVGITILITGLIVNMFSEDIGERILWFGIGVLVFIPLVSILVSALALYMERDMYWLRIALIVIAISAVGMYVSFVY